ncbi:hypothetical protein F0562_020305 [Nyssa sinensis]|uniref:Cupin type-1 domain-containing protein n=1 Tax=Nyssa sinensis TaxID=561372 RepID=A0A5J5BW43_9ASTE|nr:hypothetical protein F0562_020305 [Nyssa sinensis]
MKRFMMEKAYTPASFTYFFFTGTLGMLKGFSTEFISRTCNMSENELNKLVNSQTGALITKLSKILDMPAGKCKGTDDEFVFNLDNALADINVKNAGSLTTLTAAKLPVLTKLGVSASLVKLDANAMCSPMYTTDSEVQLTYIVKGSGKIEIVGFNGECLLGTTVQAGQMPVFGQLAGATSVWKALSPAILQASLNVTEEFAELFSSKMKDSTVFIPPPK